MTYRKPFIITMIYQTKIWIGYCKYNKDFSKQNLTTDTVLDYTLQIPWCSDEFFKETSVKVEKLGYGKGCVTPG